MSSFNDSPLGQTVWYDPGCHFSLAVLSFDLFTLPIQIVVVYSIEQICGSVLVFGFFAVEPFNSRATAPEASFYLHGCHLTAVSLGVILTRRHSVRVVHSTVFQSILKSFVSGQSDASGVAALL